MVHFHFVPERREHLIWKALLVLFVFFALFGSRWASGRFRPMSDEGNIGTVITEKHQEERAERKRALEKAQAEDQELKAREARDWSAQAKSVPLEKESPRPSIRPYP